MNDYNSTLLVIALRWVIVIGGWIAAIVGLIISSILNKKLERFKIKFSKLQEKRTEVIARIYSLLVKAQWATESYMTFGNYDNEKHNSACIATNKLRRYFITNQIYFPKPIRNLLAELIEKLLEKVFGFTWHLITSNKDLPEEVRGNQYKNFVEEWNDFKTEFPKLLTILEKEIDKILGTD